NQPNEIGRVRQIAIMHPEANVLEMRILIEMINALGIERRRTPFHSVYRVAFCKQQFGEIGAVLPCYTGNERHLARHPCSFRNSVSALASAANLKFLPYRGETPTASNYGRLVEGNS